MGSLWIIWLLMDISKYIQMMKEYWEKGRDPPEIEFVEGPEGELLIRDKYLSSYGIPMFLIYDNVLDN